MLCGAQSESLHVTERRRGRQAEATEIDSANAEPWATKWHSGGGVLQEKGGWLTRASKSQWEAGWVLGREREGIVPYRIGCP